MLILVQWLSSWPTAALRLWLWWKPDRPCKPKCAEKSNQWWRKSPGWRKRALVLFSYYSLLLCKALWVAFYTFIVWIFKFILGLVFPTNPKSADRFWKAWATSVSVVVRITDFGPYKYNWLELIWVLVEVMKKNFKLASKRITWFRKGRQGHTALSSLDETPKCNQHYLCGGGGRLWEQVM